MIRRITDALALGILIPAFLAGTAAPAQTPGPVDGRSAAQLLRPSYTSTVTGKERDYFLYLPKGYETEKGRLWPVILFLHGGGERGDGKKELDRVLKHGPLKEAWVKGRDLPFIIISPQMPPLEPELRRAREEARRKRPRGPRLAPGMSREPTGEEPLWGDEGPPQGWWVYEKDVLNMVDRTLAEYRADPDRVYVTGLSYGGFGAFHFAAAFPYRWAAVAPICGAANPKTVARIAEAKLPIWIFAGGRDRVVRPEWVLRSAVQLEEAGHPDVRFTVHEDQGHSVWNRVYEGWDLYNWFLQHRRRRPEGGAPSSE